MSGEVETESEQWVIYVYDDDGEKGRFLGVENTREEAKKTAQKWAMAFQTGEKWGPSHWAGISMEPVADFDEWKDGDSSE